MVEEKDISPKELVDKYDDGTIRHIKEVKTRIHDDIAAEAISKGSCPKNIELLLAMLERDIQIYDAVCRLFDSDGEQWLVTAREVIALISRDDGEISQASIDIYNRRISKEDQSEENSALDRMNRVYGTLLHVCG